MWKTNENKDGAKTGFAALRQSGLLKLK
jgi:hypothetical protein